MIREQVVALLARSLCRCRVGTLQDVLALIDGDLRPLIDHGQRYAPGDKKDTKSHQVVHTGPEHLDCDNCEHEGHYCKTCQRELEEA